MKRNLDIRGKRKLEINELKERIEKLELRSLNMEFALSKLIEFYHLSKLKEHKKSIWRLYKR